MVAAENAVSLGLGFWHSGFNETVVPVWAAREG